MKEICTSCLHRDVCKLRDNYTALNKAAENLSEVEEAKSGAFVISISCVKYYNKGDYLMR